VTDHLLTYLRGFTISLRARNKAPRTVESYVLAVEQLADSLEAHGHPTALGEIRRKHIEEFIADTLQTRAPATAAHRYSSIQQFWRWAVDEGEIDNNPMTGMKKPKIPDKPVPMLSEDNLRDLLEVSKGTGFEERRDTAILWLFIDTGARLSEIAELKVGDIDLDRQQLVTVVKGQHVQVKYFGARTAQALDRYERARRRHRLAHLDWLWLSLKGRLSASGIRQMMQRRAAQAGIEHIHPHQFRHTFAHRWLSEGGSEGDLQRLMGWKDRQMLDRYASSGATARARDAHVRMGLGDRL
jgi:site-specific recombinase XerD